PVDRMAHAQTPGVVMMTSKVTSAYQTLRSRVLRVAVVHRRSAVTEGAGRLAWLIGLPLLAVLLLQIAIGLPFYLRVPVLPLLAGGAVLALWITAFAMAPRAMASAFASLGGAWGDVRNIAQKIGGAKIVIEALDHPAYLRGSDVTIHANQHGFHAGTMQALVRN